MHASVRIAFVLCTLVACTSSGTGTMGLPGVKGDPGPKGADGAPGAPGAPGPNGSADDGAAILTKLKTVTGPGNSSGLDADSVGGIDSNSLQTKGLRAIQLLPIAALVGGTAAISSQTVIFPASTSSAYWNVIVPSDLGTISGITVTGYAACATGNIGLSASFGALKAGAALVSPGAVTMKADNFAVPGTAFLGITRVITGIPLTSPVTSVAPRDVLIVRLDRFDALAGTDNCAGNFTLWGAQLEYQSN
jgi:hypothetical protein